MAHLNTVFITIQPFTHFALFRFILALLRWNEADVLQLLFSRGVFNSWFAAVAVPGMRAFPRGCSWDAPGERWVLCSPSTGMVWVQWDAVGLRGVPWGTAQPPVPWFHHAVLVPWCFTTCSNKT